MTIGEKALRSRHQVVAGWVLGGLFIAIGLTQLANNDPLAAIAIPLVGVTIIGLLCWRAGLWVSDRGVRVRNLIGGFSLPWDEIEAFAIGRHKLLSAVLLIRLRDGSTRHVFAIQVANWSIRNPQAPERRLVAELNRLPQPASR